MKKPNYARLGRLFEKIKHIGIYLTDEEMDEMEKVSTGAEERILGGGVKIGNNELIRIDSPDDTLEEIGAFMEHGEDFKPSRFEAEGEIKTSYRDIEIETKRCIIDLNFILAKFKGKKVKIKIEVEE
ncbi:MAG: hypothetical protein WA125_16610 [Desulfosporosinus sp.]